MFVLPLRQFNILNIYFQENVPRHTLALLTMVTLLVKSSPLDLSRCCQTEILMFFSLFSNYSTWAFVSFYPWYDNTKYFILCMIFMTCFETNKYNLNATNIVCLSKRENN